MCVLANKKNIAIMNFGDNLNLMFNTIKGVSKISAEKKVLFLTNGKFHISPTKKLDVVEYDNNLTKEYLENYSMIVIDNDPEENFEKLRTTTDLDVAFLYLVQNLRNSDHEMFVDIDALKKMPMFKKTMEINKIRKKFSKMNMLKKFKFFK